jgi:hypothetical protein
MIESVRRLCTKTSPSPFVGRRSSHRPDGRIAGVDDHEQVSEWADALDPPGQSRHYRHGSTLGTVPSRASGARQRSDVDDTTTCMFRADERHLPHRR